MSVWEDRSEDDILECIVEAYQNARYDNIENFHKYDRRHEEGIDLACQGFGEKIHLQAKVKPRLKDVKQLEKLSESSADRKIYVYVKQPTRSFKSHIAKLKGLVEFWNSKKLHDFLVSNQSQVYFRYLFLDCELVRDIYNILIQIFSCSKIDPKPLDSSILKEWWDLKDRAVKLHANLEHLELYWKDEILAMDRHDPSVLENVLKKIFHSFSIIAKTCSGDLLDLIVKISNKRPSVLSRYVREVLKSSSWIGMNHLKDEVDNPAEARNIIQEWVLPSGKYGSEYSLIDNYLRNLHYASIAIEDGVDFLFDAFIGE